MKRLYFPLLCTLALSLAACSGPATPVAAAASGHLTAQVRLPDPTCVTASGADWATGAISVNRFSAPTAPHANVSFTVSAPATVTARISAPLGVSVSPGTLSSTTTRLAPVTAGPP